MLLSILAFIVVLGVLIFVHEAGHFLAAKWAGIYVHRFSLGLGPPIPGLSFRRGETEYAVAWLPLGGYVKMASREEDAASAILEGQAGGAPVPADRMFEAKPVWKRIVVILAGVTMNVLFAWAVFVGLAAKNGRTVNSITTVGGVDTTLVPPGGEALRQIEPGARVVAVDGEPVEAWDDIEQGILNSSEDTVRITLADGSTVALAIHPDALSERIRASQAIRPWVTPVVDSVVPGTPAAAAGLQPGDTIVAAAGAPIWQWEDLLDVVGPRAGQALSMEVARNGRRLHFELTPTADTVTTPSGERRQVGRIGIAVVIPSQTERYSIGEALVVGTQSTAAAGAQIVRTVRGMLSGRISSREVGGPILIGQLAGATARLGLDQFFGFMALISVNLAILNLLPVPVLDGGQFLLLVAEGVIRRPLPTRLREGLTALGLVIVVLLMGLAFSNDIRRLFGE